jgi:trehalose 6-phosphate phosphatase
MTEPDSLPRPDDGWALFLDVDGTLIEIVDAPDRVRVDADVCDLLAGLDRRFGHAVALVSGRPLATLDELFAPLRLTAAGLHGLERRDVDGNVVRPSGTVEELDRVRRELRAFAGRDSRLLVEDKGLTVALHFRRAPELAGEVTAFASELARRIGNRFILQNGKMVLEFRPHGPNKGDVVESFMAAPPFRGRVPVFIGDDVTDEDGFATVNRLLGHSILVGPAARTAARWRVEGVAELRRWLATMTLGGRKRGRA